MGQCQDPLLRGKSRKSEGLITFRQDIGLADDPKHSPKQEQRAEDGSETKSRSTKALGKIETLRKSREAQKRISLELETRTINKNSKEEGYMQSESYIK